MYIEFLFMKFGVKSEKCVFFIHFDIKKTHLRRNTFDNYVVLHASLNILICRRQERKPIIKCDSKIVNYAVGKVTQLSSCAKATE